MTEKQLDLFRCLAKAKPLYHPEPKTRRVFTGDVISGFFFPEAEDDEDRMGFGEGWYLQMPYGDHYTSIEIDPTTLKRSTGRYADKSYRKYNYGCNPLLIFDGDIFSAIRAECGNKLKVIGYINPRNDNTDFYVVENYEKGTYSGSMQEYENIEIIGNILTHPELLLK